MRDEDFLAERFESHRGRLLAVARRMLGSSGEAEDAVQEAWVRMSRSDTSHVDNLGGWLTTVVGRVCLDMLRARRSRAEQPLEPEVPVPAAVSDPEQDVLLADSVGSALLVVLDTLTPAERLAFVLHDLFAVPYDEVAGVIGKSPAAARQLGSRARRRVRGAQATETGPARRRELVDAFLAAAREGDFEGLLAVLDPDVVVRTEAGVTTGALAVAKGATGYARHITGVVRPALVEGRTGFALLRDGRVERTLAFTFVHDRIAVIDITTDPATAARSDVTLL
ncbi:RNA polymerase sigma-70 factor (ECF subfamily) [Streptomyces sp. SAI-135]|uniref:sigma-70 family RNA polymerase sigma factor n=1 Tax=unclassified Streptomyces TaxID=2593676 RepID=UPI00247483DB|nr:MULTISPECIES: sigma-70 family RNA polymerase sigma factor [unclassified Streptomyces]MDH6518241.1 RNA polymerase sigma-70 factor (ECF subfamily) [Streptomyces sp. SAI-090]MDH6617669.1 RNA polymerase sigma-70 factor (ECF subfamily) [Streptomyces sp. SAI-135]